MADKKISQLDPLFTAAASDVIPIVDLTVPTETKKITLAHLMRSPGPIGTTTPNVGEFTTLELSIGATINEFSTDGTLAGNSDNTIPTEKAIKTYVDIEQPNDNILINQDYTVWQNGITFANPADDAYTADGYYVSRDDGGGTAPVVNVKKNTIVHETAYAQSCELEIAHVGVAGATRYWRYLQEIKDYEKYAGRTVTLSIRLKASAAINLPGGRLVIDDSTGGNYISITSIGTDWTTYSTTLTVDSSLTELLSYLSLVEGAGVISTTASIYIQYMKLELNSTDTPLTPRSDAEEYLLCGTVIAPLNRTDPSVRFEDDAGNLGILIEDGGAVSLQNGTSINEFSIDGTLAGNSDDAVSTEKAVKTYVDTTPPIAHTIASHSDTLATGAELNTLTNNSIADALHRHSELVASDGAPDPALSIDADGIASFYYGINMGDQIIDQPTIRDYGETVNDLGNLGGDSTEAYVIDLELGNVVIASIDSTASTVIFSFINPPVSGTAGSFTLILTNGGTPTVTWPTSVKWENEDAPILTIDGVDILEFLTVDEGTIWYGFSSGSNMG